MITLRGLDLALVWVAVTAAVAFPVRYWIGAKWWRNPLGWVLMSLAAIIILLYTKSVLSLLTGNPLKVTGPNVAINAVVAAWIVAADIVIDHIIRKDQREQGRARSRTRDKENSL